MADFWSDTPGRFAPACFGGGFGRDLENMSEGYGYWIYLEEDGVLYML